MQIEEARKLVAVLMVTYSNYNPIDEELAAETWANATEEYTYEQVNMALGSYIRSNTSGFAPAPGQVINKMHLLTTPDELNEIEAWSLVSQAIRNSVYNSALEFAKLPPLVQKAVGVPDQLRIWALDEHYNESVVSSNFIKCYRSVVGREKELQKMSPEIRKIVESVNKDSYAGKIEQKRQQAIERNSEDSKRLEMKHDGIQMPEKYRERFEDMRNEEQTGKMQIFVTDSWEGIMMNPIV